MKMVFIDEAEMKPYFFMSYAHEDDQGLELGRVEAFFEELRSQIRIRTADDLTRCGFFDSSNLHVGQHWADEVITALNTCQVFVPILTAAYFTRPHCGREWAFFERRLEALASSRQQINVPLILPVLWTTPHYPFPGFVESIQWVPPSTDASTEAERWMRDLYLKRGLSQILKRRHNVSTADTFCFTVVEYLADAILTAARESNLPECQEIIPLSEVKPKFPSEIAPPNAGGSDIQPTSESALVAVAAACNGEIDRLDIAARYGQKPEAWKPFTPVDDQRIGMRAQEVLFSRNLFVYPAEVAECLPENLREAETEHAVAILIVDPWAVRLVPRYKDILMKIDLANFSNFILALVWSPEDAEDHKVATELLETINQVLGRQLARNSELSGGPFHNAEDFMAFLKKATEALEAKLAPKRAPRQTAGKSSYSQLPRVTF